MIKSTSPFQVWQINKYYVFTEYVDDAQKEEIQEHINRMFDVRTLSNTSSYLISQDFNNGISKTMVEFVVVVQKKVRLHKGNEYSFIHDYALVRLQALSNKYKKTIYLKCNMNIPNVYIPEHFVITPEL